jgi:hypothetical protein
MSGPITDPALLRELEGVPVADPALIAQLEDRLPAPQSMVGMPPALPKPSTALGRFITGMMDPVLGFAQMAARSGYTDPETGARGVASPEDIDRYVSQRETEYGARRALAGSSGFDWARTGGNIAATAPLMALPGGQASALGRVGAAAATGAGQAMLQPADVQPGETFANEKAKQALIGALAPTAMMGGANVAGRVIRGVSDPDVQALIKAGVNPTLGQTLGGVWNTVEQKLSGVIPGLGDAISYARRGAQEDLNRAVYNNVLEPLGEKYTGPISREGYGALTARVSGAYDKVLSRMQAQRDPAFDQGISNLQNLIGNSKLPQEIKDRFRYITDNDVLGQFSKGGGMSGETLKQVQRVLNGEIARLDTRDVYQQKLQLALIQTKHEFDDMLARTNPADAAELKAANAAFARLATVDPAAAAIGNKAGVFTAAQLANAVKRGDLSPRDKAYAAGTAFMQNLSDPANRVLSSSYPDSGTAGRAALAALLGEGAGHFGVVEPHTLLATAAGLGAASLPYLPGGRQLTAAVLAKRPALAAPVAAAIQGASPALGLAAIPPLLRQ